MKYWWRWFVLAGFLVCGVRAPAAGGAESFDAEIRQVTEALRLALDGAHVATVATLDFTDLKGEKSDLGRLLAEEISSNLVMGQKTFSVVDRLNLRRLMEENHFDYNLSKEGVMHPEDVKKLGKIAGVQAFVIGTITPFETDMRLNVKALAAETAMVMAAAQGRLTRTPTLDGLLGLQPAPPAPDAGAPMAVPVMSAIPVHAAQIESPKAAPLRINLGEVEAEVQSLRVQKSGLARVILALRNVTEREVFVAVENYTYRSVVGRDNAGQAYQLQNAEGIDIYGRPLSPGVPLTCQLVFQSGEDDGYGRWRGLDLKQMPMTFSVTVTLTVGGERTIAYDGRNRTLSLIDHPVERIGE